MTTQRSSIVSVFLLLAAALSLGPSSFARQPPAARKPAPTFEQRADELIAQMTLEEKVSQLMNDSPAIERLGIPAYNWWGECLHGVARAGRATVFPQTIGLAATWDPNLLLRVGTTISDEARAKHHEAVRRGKRGIYHGLTFWTPNINLFRDPRWGRGMETYGEDPYLTSRLAIQLIKGMQGDDPTYLKTIATVKHYAVHSGPEPLRHVFDAAPSPRDLRATYLPHFEDTIREGGAWSVMCAYNRVAGLPACASPRLLDEILRKEWGFGGYVVSDCGAIGDVYLNHKTSRTPEEGVARAIQAGTDLDCGVEYGQAVAAVKKGLLSEADVDRSVRRLLVARFKLGMFDPPAKVKWARIPYSKNDSPQNRQLALDTARKSIVLLKNEGSLLPLAKTVKSIAVIGPNADDVDVLLGNYNGIPSAPVTPLAGIRAKVPRARVLYARGSDVAPGIPRFEPVPSTVLFTSDQADRKNGLNAEYYASGNFDGQLHRPAEQTYPRSGRMVGEIPRDPRPLFTRVDPQVNFQWWDGAPRKDMNDDDFGVRWTGYLSVAESGTYQLGAYGLNAFQLTFDGKPLAKVSGFSQADYSYGAVVLEAGKFYPIRLDYTEFHQAAEIRLVWSPPAKNLEQEVADAVQAADVAVVFLGLSPRLEGEEMDVPVNGFAGGDRVTLGLPRVQEELLKKVVGYGKPVVVVLLNGSGLAVAWAQEHVPAIVEAWYPGQAGGTAIADVLFGDVNPAGRLPITFYKSAADLPPFQDYGMKGKTYRYFKGTPLYPFGYGLSYTTFAYRNLVVPPQAAAGAEVKVSVEVENTGKVAGEEVVELYVKSPSAAQSGLVRSLEGFQRIALRPKQKKTITFTLLPKQLATIGADGSRKAELGDFEISVGGKQPGFTGSADAATTGVVSAPLKIAESAR